MRRAADQARDAVEPHAARADELGLATSASRRPRGRRSTDDLEGRGRAAPTSSPAPRCRRSRWCAANGCKTGTHVDLVGGFTPKMREADDAAIDARASSSTPVPAPLKEAGDIVQPIRRGVIAESDDRRRPVRAVRAARRRPQLANGRSRCSSRSARRSRISPPRCWCGGSVSNL